MFNFYKIAVNTVRESLREPVYFLMLAAALILIINTPMAALYVFSEQLKLVVDSSMATALLFGLLAAVLSASHTVTREMRNGTVLLMMSKPVARWSFILGKIAGIAFAAALFTAICSLVTVQAVYVAAEQFREVLGIYIISLVLIALAAVIGMAANYWKGSAFPEVGVWSLAILMTIFTLVCYFTQMHPTMSLRDLGAGLLLVHFSVIAMATLSVVFATRLDVVANLCVCVIFFFLGLISGYLFHGTFYDRLDSGILKSLCDVCYAAFPNWQFFWVADALAVKRAIPVSYIWRAALYVFLYIILCSMWAVALFQNREVAGGSRM